jgi:hypothetical protein
MPYADPTTTEAMPRLAAALDDVSRQWLNDNHPELAEALEWEITLGATPDCSWRRGNCWTPLSRCAWPRAGRFPCPSPRCSRLNPLSEEERDADYPGDAIRP